MVLLDDMVVDVIGFGFFDVEFDLVDDLVGIVVI